jgi:hypothetical protein
MNWFTLVAVLTFICIISVTRIDCDAVKRTEKDKMTAKKLKHAKPSLKTCNANFEKDFNPIEEKRLFLSTQSRYTLASKQSIIETFEHYRNECISQPEFTELSKSFVELKWRYQFLESAHCIRIELDLGNVTHFKSVFNYSHYMFSYRELRHRNTHVKRQPIVDKVNTLTIHRVNIRPYIVCVTFYKGVEINYSKSDGSEPQNITKEVTFSKKINTIYNRKSR